MCSSGPSLASQTLSVLQREPNQYWKRSALQNGKGLACETTVVCVWVFPHSTGGCLLMLTLLPGPTQILSRSRGETGKIGRRPGIKICHGPEMVDSVCTNQVHITYWLSPPFPVRDVVLPTILSFIQSEVRLYSCLIEIFHHCRCQTEVGLNTPISSECSMRSLPDLQAWKV